ncbi:hypothetical protein KCP69_09455 [Salmonella enterica subsp. enterica]|nr:hypothetical protein KCP69_09455 [Salmonella enterica subsp. enterica]
MALRYQAYILAKLSHTQKPVRLDGFFHLSDARSFAAGVLLATLRAAKRNVQNLAPGGFVLSESAHRQTTDK